MGDAATALKRAAVVAVFGLVLAACSNSPSSSAGSGSNGSNGSNGSSGSASATIGTDKVQGLGTVLDTSSGLTLYHNTKESNGTIVCTGACATTWPPIVVSGSVPSAPSGVMGTFGTVNRPDGTVQLTLDGMPLYTYAGDTKAGQAAGQGLGGIWFAVGPEGAITKSASKGGSGYGSSSGGSW